MQLKQRNKNLKVNLAAQRQKVNHFIFMATIIRLGSFSFECTVQTFRNFTGFSLKKRYILD